ncbi:MAG: hypothetical protein ABEJ78_05725 [Haloferacaceae archaeon]
MSDEEMDEPRPEEETCNAPGCEKPAPGDRDFCDEHREEQAEVAAREEADEPMGENASESYDETFGVRSEGKDREG